MMAIGNESENQSVKNRTTVERRSDLELVVTRTFNGPARIVFDAWTKPEHLKKWWAPQARPHSALGHLAQAQYVAVDRMEPDKLMPDSEP